MSIPLSAEEEAEYRVRSDLNPHQLRRLFATLDAARADTLDRERAGTGTGRADGRVRGRPESFDSAGPTASNVARHDARLGDDRHDPRATDPLTLDEAGDHWHYNGFVEAVGLAYHEETQRGGPLVPCRLEYAQFIDVDTYCECRYVGHGVARRLGVSPTMVTVIAEALRNVCHVGDGTFIDAATLLTELTGAEK